MAKGTTSKLLEVALKAKIGILTGAI